MERYSGDRAVTIFRMKIFPKGRRAAVIRKVSRLTVSHEHRGYPRQILLSLPYLRFLDVS